MSSCEYGLDGKSIFVSSVQVATRARPNEWVATKDGWRVDPDAGLSGAISRQPANKPKLPRGRDPNGS